MLALTGLWGLVPLSLVLGLGLGERSDLAPSAVSSALDRHPSLSASAEVTRGRARVLGVDGFHELQPGATRDDLRGPLHVETSPGTQIDLAWPGMGSLRSVGATAFEWTRGEVLEWRLLAGGELFLEVRRGSARLHLPFDWQLEIESGAFYAHGLPGGATEVHVDAAGPIRVEVPGDRRWPRPPIVLFQGARVRFESARRLRILSGASHVVHDPRALLEPGASARPERADSAYLEDERAFTWPWHKVATGASEGDSTPRGAEPRAAAQELAPVPVPVPVPVLAQAPAPAPAPSPVPGAIRTLRTAGFELARRLATQRPGLPLGLRSSGRALASALRQALESARS